MMTLIGRLCALCAMSALLEMILPEQHFRGSLRVICGLLMLKLTLSGLCGISSALTQQQDLSGIFACLIE